MNRRWTLAAIAPLGGLVAWAVVRVLLGTAEPGLGLWGWGVVVRCSPAVGCLIAASQFDRGDHLRRAWSAIGFGYLLDAANITLFGSPTHASTQHVSVAAAVTSGAMVAVANLLTVIGLLMVARAWRVAGLALPYSAPVRVATLVGSIVLALAIAGSTTVADFHSVLEGDGVRMVSLASDLGDIASLALLAPILLTALSLRGGSLVWPWALTVAGTVGWLCLDATGTLVSLAKADPLWVRPVEEAFRAFACFSYLSAGLLQREVMRVPVIAAAPAADA